MDDAIRFLRETFAQRDRDPNHDPSGQTVAQALDLDFEDAERLLQQLLDENLLRVIPTPRRHGDGPLDELLDITDDGRSALARAADADPLVGDPAARFLHSLARHVESGQQARISAPAIAQTLRMDSETAALAIDELAEAGHIKAYNTQRMTGGPLAAIVELTPAGRQKAYDLETRHVSTSPGEPLQETWSRRDLPVLQEAARLLDSGTGWVRFSQLAQATGLALRDVEAAVAALESDGYIEARRVWPRESSRVMSLSAEARRQVGLWPTPESALDRMVAALEMIAANTDEDEATRSRARKILDGITGAGREVGLSVVAAAISGQIPGV